MREPLMSDRLRRFCWDSGPLTSLAAETAISSDVFFCGDSEWNPLNHGFASSLSPNNRPRQVGGPLIDLALFMDSPSTGSTLQVFGGFTPDDLVLSLHRLIEADVSAGGSKLYSLPGILKLDPNIGEAVSTLRSPTPYWMAVWTVGSEPVENARFVATGGGW